MCGGRVGDVGGDGDRRGGAGRVDAEQVGAAPPHDRVLVGGGGPGQFGEQLRGRRNRNDKLSTATLPELP